MRLYRRLAAIAALLGAAAAVAVAGPVLDTSAVSERTLSNGLHVVVKEAHTWPVVSVQVIVRAGSLYEGDAPAGTARAVAQALFESDRGPGQLRPLLRRLGGVVTTMADRDAVQVAFTAYKYEVKPALTLLAQGLFEATLTQDDLTRTRLQLRDQLGATPGDPYGALSEMLWRMACTGHPYAPPPSGTSADLERLRLGDLSAFYHKFYVPNNVAIIAVGDVEPDQFAQDLEATFGQSPRRPLVWEEPKITPPQSKPLVQSQPWPGALTFVGMGWRAPAVVESRDVCAMDLIYALLQPGRYSLLGPRLQPPGADEPLADDWSVEFVTHRHPAVFQILVSTTPAQEMAVRQALMDTIGDLRSQPVTEEQLMRGKQMIAAEYTYQNETYEKQASTLAFYEAIDSYRFALDYLDRINALRPADLQSAAQKYLTSSGYCLAVLRPDNGDIQEARLP